VQNLLNFGTPLFAKQTISKSTFLSGFWCINCFFFKKNARIFAYMKNLLYLCSQIELVNQFCIERTINFKSNTTMKKATPLFVLPASPLLTVWVLPAEAK